MGGNFHSFNSLSSEEFERGIHIKSLAIENAQARHLEFEPGSVIPDHRHPVKVVTVILEGDIVMTVRMEPQRFTKGDVFIVPTNTSPNAHILDKRAIAVSCSGNP